MNFLRFNVPSPSRLQRLLLVWCACFLLAPALTRAQDLPVVSDGKNVWVVRTDPLTGVVILHRQRDDEPNRLQLAAEVSGAAENHGIAAAADRLFVVYSDHTVHSYSINADALSYLRYESPSRIEPSLPAGIRILSLVASSDVLYVLVGTDKPETLAAIDAMVPVTSRPTGLLPDESDNFPVQTQPLPDLTTTLPATTQAATTAPASVPGSIRLLKLYRGDWVNIPLPSQLTDQFLVEPTSAPLDRSPSAYLVRPHMGQKDPTLLVWTPDDGDLKDDTIATLWTLDETGWKSQSRKLTGVFSAKPVVVEGQIIVSRTGSQRISERSGPQLIPTETAPATAPATLPVEKFDLYMYVLRTDGVFPVGKIPLDDASPGAWTLIPVESNLALVQKGPKDTISWTTISISPSGTRPADDQEIGSANVISPSATLFVKPYNALTDGTSTLLLAASFLFSIAVAAVVWRRNPGASPPMLPADLVPADALRRAVAFAIDIIPCLFLISTIVHIDPGDLIGNFFKQHASWEMIRPAAAVVLVYVGHTCLTEIFTGRSMGKALTGLRVVNYLGQPANVGQILLRNLLKIFEIIGWPLLFLPITLQFGQRLGDLGARTVVVSNKPEDDPDDEEDEFDDM